MSSRGPSYRATSGCSPLKDEYNMMEEHFNSESNSYNAGQLKYDKQRKSEGNSTKLHVGNVPMDMTEKGLLHIFLSEGLKPTGAFIGRSKNSDRSTTWGFVEFQTFKDAQAAISVIHKKPPHNLAVKWAHSDEQKKQDRDKNKNESLDSDSDKYSGIAMTRGRGHLAPMQGKPPSTIKSTIPHDQEFYDEPKGFNSSNHRFSHPDSTHEVSASNSVYSPFADGLYDDGNRKMSMGRGTFIKGIQQQDSIHSTSPSVPRDKFAFEEVTEEMDMKVSAYISKRFKQLSCEENLKLSSEMSLSMPFKLGICAYCSRPSIYCCSRCKEWYCCNSCRYADYPSHRKTCQPRTLVFDKSGNVSYSNIPDEFADAEETPTLINYSPRDSQSIEHGSRNFQRLSGGRDSSRFNETNGFMDLSNGHDNRNNDSVSQVGSQTGNSKGPQKDINRDNQRSMGQRNSTERNERNRGAGNRSNRGGDRNDKRGSRVHENQFVENEVYVRPPISPPESSISNMKEKKMSSQQHDVQPPIPTDQFTEVTVGSIGKNNEFIAYSSLDSKQQIEIMKTLGEFCPNVSPLSCPIDVGLRVSAPFSDGWFRAEVTKFKQSMVEVYFIDFGNTTTVEKKDLRPLPPSVISIPNLAHKYKLASNSQNIKLQEEMAINVKPVGQNKDGRWIVQVEGLTYEDFQEVAILVTENSDEYWVHKSSETTKLFQLTFGLEEHKNEDVEPVLGEVYTHKFDGLWCRAKVICKSPLKVFYIDYGNYNCVEKHELHPLPNKFASVPPMAHKIKLIEGSPSHCYNLKECSKLNIKPVRKLDNGTFLCEASPISDGGGHSEDKPVKHLLFTLNKNNTAEFWVEKVMNEDFLTGCIISQGNTPNFKNVSNILEKEVKKGESVSLTKGMMVAAYWDEEWHRGYVMLIRGKDPIIALVDRGRVVIPEAVAPLPETINKIPESAIRAIFKEPIINMNLSGEIIPAKIVKLDEDKVHVEVKSLGPAVLLPWVPAVEEAGLTSIKLTSGNKVVISSYESPTSVYLQSRLQSDVVIQAELAQDLAAHCLECETLKRRPLCGEFLAVRYADDGLYYRAQIFRRTGDQFKVTFVDFGNTDTVTVADMKPLPDYLKTVPCCAVKVGLKDVPNVPLNAMSMKCLNELCENSEELFAYFENGMDSVTLKTTDGKIINNVLTEFLTPSWKQPQFNPLAGQVFMKNDLVYENWEKGYSCECAIIVAQTVEEILVVSTNSGLLHHIESNLTPSITKYCEELPNETYNPRSNEMCLAKFHEDGKWYRAVCLKSFPHNVSKVFYVDYGNSGEVLHRCIRKMVSDFMDTPVALKSCKVYGIPARLPEPTKQKLMNWYNNCKKVEATVVDFKADKPVLWIPALQAAAEEMGFTIKSP